MSTQNLLKGKLGRRDFLKKSGSAVAMMALGSTFLPDLVSHAENVLPWNWSSAFGTKSATFTLTD